MKRSEKMTDWRKSSIIFSVVLIILSIVLIVLVKNSHIHKTKSTKNPVVLQEQETEQELTTISPEEERQHAIQKMTAYLNRISEIQTYLGMNQSDAGAFANWMAERYGTAVIQNLTENTKDSPRQNLYSFTGKSIFILMDEFLGISQERTISNKSGSANLVFAGDICLTENGFVLDHYKETNRLSDCISPEIIHMTNSADLFMLNNEFTISDRGRALAGKMYTFRANPERTSILQELGTDIVSLANNHVYDFGAEAFYDTMSNLKNAGIPYVGGGINAQEAEKVLYFDVNGIKIGFVSASRAERIRYTPEATSDTAGIFLMYNPARLYDICSDAANRCDYLIAFVHWGTEDSIYYEQYQHDIAAEMIRRGVDAIIGAHPHVLQGIEYIEGKPVVYSLGDFWFNNETKYNGLICLNIHADGYVSMGIRPTMQTGFTTIDITDLSQQQAYRDYVNGLSNGCVLDEQFEFHIK